VVARLGERRTLLMGLLFGMVGFALYGFARTGSVFWLAIPLSAPIGLYGPAAQGIMSHHVSPSEQGQLQGANSSIMGITGLIGPVVFTSTFAAFIGALSYWKLPGAPFLLASLLMTAATVVAFRVTGRANAKGVTAG